MKINLLSGERGVGVKYQLVFSTSDIGNIHVVSRRTEIFILPLSKDLHIRHERNTTYSYINSNQVDFSVTVLSSFGSTHVDDLKISNLPLLKEGIINLTRTSFNKNISILTKCRALHRKTIALSV